MPTRRLLISLTVLATAAVGLRVASVHDPVSLLTRLPRDVGSHPHTTPAHSDHAPVLPCAALDARTPRVGPTGPTLGPDLSFSIAVIDPVTGTVRIDRATTAPGTFARRSPGPGFWTSGSPWITTLEPDGSITQRRYALLPHNGTFVIAQRRLVRGIGA